jgi:hypothetical protein
MFDTIVKLLIAGAVIVAIKKIVDKMISGASLPGTRGRGMTINGKHYPPGKLNLEGGLIVECGEHGSLKVTGNGSMNNTIISSGTISEGVLAAWGKKRIEVSGKANRNNTLVSSISSGGKIVITGDGNEDNVIST